MKGTLPNRARFGGFELDLKAGELYREGHAVRLQEQPFQVLRMLVLNAGHLVTREEIRQKLWPNDTVVEFDHGINTAIQKLRRALGESADQPSYVQTVARRGYRLIVPVERVDSTCSDDPAVEAISNGSAANAMQAPLRSESKKRPDDPSDVIEEPQLLAGNLVGKKVSHYRLLEILGGGGMGVVYKAEDLKLGRWVAMKFLPEELGGDSKARERFEREARAVSALSHPNICPIYEFDEYEGQPFIVMELLQGKTLRERIADGAFRLSDSAGLDIAIQVASGVEAAHEQGIIHRDIKPANIFITEKNDAKILDFGLAKVAGRAVAASGDLETATGDSDAQHLTKPQAMLGTMAYMSPEQVRAQNLDVRTDLFSFGAVLYEMATGKMPFNGGSSSEICSAILRDDPTPPSQLRPEVSAGLEAVIYKALEKDRNLRYQHASDMRTDLQRLKRETESARLVAVASGSGSNSRLPRSVDSLAVLPLVNATGDPETEYLSDGISESIINLLSQLPHLRVIPRTSAFRYKGREADLKMIGRDLKVRTVLTGKMIQRGDRLFVQTELVDVPNDAQIWGGHFNRKLEDIFDVQEELARQISESLQLQLTPEEEKRLARRPTQNREAYQFLLKAQYHAIRPTRESLQRALAYARQAIEADPGYAEAYGWMSATYSFLGLWDFVPPAEAFAKAKAAAHKALEIDDSLAVAHAALGTVRLWSEWDWSGAENSYKRAIELNANWALGHAAWSDLLTVMGRIEEAIAEARLAVELDPLSAGHNVGLGWKIGLSGDYDGALEQLQKALELDPNHMFTNIHLALNYSRKGMYDEGLAICQKVVNLSGNSPFSRALSSLTLAMAGKTDEAQKILIELKRYRNLDSWSLFFLAGTCSVMGEKTEAFEFLEVAYQQRSSLLILLNVSPSFRNIRTDPRYADLLRRMRLPQAPLPHPEAC